MSTPDSEKSLVPSRGSNSRAANFLKCVAAVSSGMLIGVAVMSKIACDLISDFRKNTACLIKEQMEEKDLALQERDATFQVAHRATSAAGDAVQRYELLVEKYRGCVEMVPERERILYTCSDVADKLQSCRAVAAERMIEIQECVQVLDKCKVPEN